MALNKKHISIAALAGTGIAVVAIAGGDLATHRGWDGQGGLFRASAPVMANAPGTPMSFADIFERVAPAVVSIHVVGHAEVNVPQGFPFGLIPREAEPDEGDGNGRKGQGPKQRGAGSGFFISPDGYILTNNHVIDGAEEIKVVMNDGKELKATVVGRDEGTDLAVIRVDGHDFPYVSFENSARPRVGDWVLAVGNPFDLGGTATAGIVSAYKRDIGDRFVDYIQIDAPINRGNSGGPTFDVYGRVIGVNTQIFSPSGGSVGIGFDIPADVAEQVAKKLMGGGKITRGYIGAVIQNADEELVGSMGLSERKAALVVSVAPGGPASKAGLHQGDLVTTVNGVKVGSSSEMTREVAKAQPGQTIHLELYRDGKPLTVDIRSGTRPSERSLVLGQNQPSDGADEGQDENGGASGASAAAGVGLSVSPLTAVVRQELNLGPEVRGVVVNSVKSGSDAAEKGLQRGDIIIHAGDRDVASPADLAAAVRDWKRAGRKSIALGVMRRGQTQYLPVKIDG